MSALLHLGIVQMTSVDDVAANLSLIKSLYQSAVDQGANLVVFPENSLFLRLSANLPIEGIQLDGPELRKLQEVVQKLGVPVLLTTPLSTGAGRLRNSTLLIRENGSIGEVYSKIHLFDVDVKGAPSVRESEHFENGEQPALIDVAGWKIGLSICYDLRFSELFSSYAQLADLILVPSAFLIPTGQAHWHVLLRARAIEAQAFVAAPAQSGEHKSSSGDSRHTYGHSLLIDPWGRVMAELKDSPEVVVVELSKLDIETVRRQIPMESHRRLKNF